MEVQEFIEYVESLLAGGMRSNNRARAFYLAMLFAYRENWDGIEKEKLNDAATSGREIGEKLRENDET